MNQFKITFRPAGKFAIQTKDKTVAIEEGTSILEAARRGNIAINSVCGGNGICGKCAVLVGQEETEVLACQYKIKSDLAVKIPEYSDNPDLKILVDGIHTSGSIRHTYGGLTAGRKIEPDIYKKYLKIAKEGRIFGLAADIGTTTVVVKLIDMKSGNCIGTESALNPQSFFGDDVISRISYAGTRDGLSELGEIIKSCLNELIGRLCKKSKVDRREIYEASIVGNTTMNHLFLKMAVKGLGRAPYEAYNVKAQKLYPSEAGIQINPHGNIYTVANIASFLGSDTTAAALAAGMGETEKTTLLVDIGTNGEVVLGNKDRLLATSCAAGPAFEGARISRGSRAVKGAIEAVEWDGKDLTVKVIGSSSVSEARSICGSGLIDAVAVLVELGIIDSTGRIVKKKGLSEGLSSRITEEDGQPAVLIAKGEKEILLTQKDVRQVQLAKAAISAGIKILQSKLGLNAKDIEQVLLAGAFGNFTRKESAMRIGLLPELPVERIHFIGNAACSGAEIILLSDKERILSSELAGRIEYIELARETDFEAVFSREMHF
jgi:uncharacterized 2Fe-2S/4Fe-4S cluster protein (DUF4445 family)